MNHHHRRRRSTLVEPCPDKLVVRETGHSSRICDELRRQALGKVGRPSQVLVQRKRLDALLAGTLQDIFTSHMTWEHGELNASSKWSLRLLEVLSTRKQVRSLIVKEPSELVLEFLGSWLQNQQSKCATMDHLSIRSGILPSSSALALSQGLKSKECTVTSLEILNISFVPEAVQAMGTGLSQHGRMEKISFQSCHLEDAEVALLVRALKAHSSLIELNLSHNYCQEKAAVELCQLLTCPTASLLVLDISNQDNWDDRHYFSHYAKALANPTCPLRELNVASNFVNDEQFCRLVDALKTNTCLEVLNLQDNRIADIGIKYLVQALPNTAKLKQLDISRNRYGRGVLKDLQDILAVQTSLARLGMDRKDVVPRISYYLALNRAGRYCKSAQGVPLGLWPLILEHGRLSAGLQPSSDDDLESPTIGEADILFELLRGPALLER